MKDSVIFLGDSLTEWGHWSNLFPGINVINEGIAGNTTSDIIKRIDLIEGKGASKLFLMIGINDLANGTPVPKILENYEIIIDRIKNIFPETDIFLLSTLPMKFSKFRQEGLSRENLEKLNKGIMRIAAKNRMSWIDMVPAFSDEKGNLLSRYTSDGLHLSIDGYLKWKDELNDYIRQQ
ncbi:MAG: GDSL-type esterase/lipase family protein [Bacteroidales bacterium]